ncbi:uncharacterized protein LOC109709283 isoform X2 [Ananas comosus]|uniref:Uncharacterized protein LOC109709283 isoform X2 n=1 Tax=Ananas comosus TaxID=4615 RepID=A0A6P5EU57_ANACO|nr:uncharacterized protein LOC109709283 isoform X2 [Ananas comosus]
MALALLLLFPPPPRLPSRNPNPRFRHKRKGVYRCCCYCSTRREAMTNVAIVSIASLTPLWSFAAEDALPESSESASSSRKSPILGGISSTKSWSQFFGDGFAIRVPPLFEDIMEPEDYSTGFTFYGDKAKPKTFAARFASPDRSEVLSVVIRPSNQLKITFLEAKDITDLGSLKEAAKIFVPGGANLYSARTIKIKDDESLRTYYFYEFGIDTQHVALVAAVNNGKAYIVGAAAPQVKWGDDGVKLRSAAISLSVL